MTHLLTLRKPKEGEPLNFYCAVIEKAISSILVRVEGKRKWPVYYVSKSLDGAEVRYPIMEKAIYALKLASRRLWPYFQGHPITV